MKKEEYWLIPPSRCRYAQQFNREVKIGECHGTKTEVICCLKEDPLLLYKCCEQNCRKMDELERIMFVKKKK